MCDFLTRLSVVEKNVDFAWRIRVQSASSSEEAIWNL